MIYPERKSIKFRNLVYCYQQKIMNIEYLNFDNLFQNCTAILDLETFLNSVCTL